MTLKAPSTGGSGFKSPSDWHQPDAHEVPTEDNTDGCSMSDALQTVTKFIGQLAAGGLLAGGIWKLFERIEIVLTDETKHQVAAWLRVRSVESALIAESAVNCPPCGRKMESGAPQAARCGESSASTS